MKITEIQCGIIDMTNDICRAYNTIKIRDAK